MIRYLSCQLPSNELFLLGCDLLGELEGLEPVLEVHSHFEGQLLLGALHETLLGKVMLEQNGRHMSHQHKLLSLVLDALDRVDHSDILAHLECCLRVKQLQVLEAVLAEDLKELQLQFLACLGDIDAVLILVQSQALQEIAKMALVCFLITAP